MSEEKLLKEECFSWTLDIAIITITTFRNEKFYTCCDEPYLDITFNITMRRKTLFYTVRLYHDFSGVCKPILHFDFLLLQYI